jgi:hypothetical protein
MLFVTNLLVLGLIFASTSNAQTDYQTNGQILPQSTNWHIIQNIQVDDLVLISITQIESQHYDSAIFFPNLTRVAYDYGSGAQSYQFIAPEPGDYLLRIFTGADSSFNYSITSSHPISTDDQTPNKINGQIQPATTIWHKIQDVEVNDLVLTSLNQIETSTYVIVLYFPNLTETSWRDYSSGAPYSRGTHSYQFKAPEPGDYLLRIDTNADESFNYTITSSHPIEGGDNTGPPETPTEPETPEQPTTPEEPETPEEPTTPEQPTTPEEPETPEEPSETSEVTIDFSEPIRKAPPVPLAAPEAVAVTTVATVALGGITLTQLFQKFVNTYADKSWEKVSEKEMKKLRAEPRVTKIELGHIATSIVVMTLVFGVVEANGLLGLMDLSSFLIILPSALLSTFFTSSVIKIWSIGSEMICGKLSDVYRRFSLWRFGLGTFIVSGLLFSFAFSSPGLTKFKTDKESEDQTRKIKGLLALSKALLVLILSALFAGIMMFLDIPVIGDSGLLITIMTVCYSLVPVEPLPGRQLYEYNKLISIGSLTALAFLLYSTTFYLLPVEVFFAIGLASIPLAIIVLYKMNRAKSQT